MSASNFGTTAGADESVGNEYLRDSDVRVLISRFPSGVRDFQLFVRSDAKTVQLLNPIELLGTEMAVRVLRLASRHGGAGPQFALSRLLTQCLEYRGNRRHLILEPWDEADLRGATLYEGNRTEYARDCSVERAERFRVVMSGEVSLETELEDVYWGAFSTLPPVEDAFDHLDLARLCQQLYARIIGPGALADRVTVNISAMRALVRSAWDDNFRDFELEITVKQRRQLFKILMSVAVRQASTLIERIAYGFVIQNAAKTARKRDREFFSEPERRLFDIRYGSCSSLGNINIGFLFDCDDLHAALVNDLAGSLVRQNSEPEWDLAEQNLHRHIQLLDELRELRRSVRAEQRQATRLNRQDQLPEPRIQAEGQEDQRPSTSVDEVMSSEQMEQLRRVIGRLKPRDQIRAQAVLDAGGDKDAAAQALGIERETFYRQYRQTTKPNLNKAMRQTQQEEGDIDG